MEPTAEEAAVSSGEPGAGAPRLSRRQAIGRVSKGAVAVGVAAWVVPEIVVATPTAAGAASAPPGRPGGDDGNPSGDPSGGDAHHSGDPGNGGGSGNSGGGTGDAAARGGGAGGSGSGGLAVTGFDALGGAGAGAALVGGGWALTHWSGHHGRAATAGAPEHSGHEDPTA